MKRSVLLIALTSVLLGASPSLSQLPVSPRVIREMNAVQQEILSRDPSARPFEGYDQNNVEQSATRMARDMSDAQLAAAFASYARMTGARMGTAAPAPVPADVSAPGTGFAKGQRVEILSHEKWWPGEVLETDGARAKVRYDQLGSYWDEWVAADRLRPGASPRPSRPPAEAASASIGQFAKGQRVEALAHEKWWPGEVLETDGARAKIRYDSLGSYFDEWVTADRLRPSSTPRPRSPTGEAPPTSTPAPRRPVQSQPAPPAPPPQSRPAGKHEASCKPQYERARTECFLRDRQSFSCPAAANVKYLECLKSGRW